MKIDKATKIGRINFFDKTCSNRTKKITKNTSKKNRYWAENKRTKILLIKIEIKRIHINFDFLRNAKTEKMTKLRINRI